MPVTISRVTTPGGLEVAKYSLEGHVGLEEAREVVNDILRSAPQRVLYVVQLGCQRGMSLCLFIQKMLKQAGASGFRMATVDLNSSKPAFLN